MSLGSACSREGWAAETAPDSLVCPGIRAYEQLGSRAFGTPGKLAAALAITLQNIGGEAGRQRAGGQSESRPVWLTLTPAHPSPPSHVQLPVHHQVRVAPCHTDLPEPGGANLVSPRAWEGGVGAGGPRLAPHVPHWPWEPGGVVGEMRRSRLTPSPCEFMEHLGEQGWRVGSGVGVLGKPVSGLRAQEGLRAGA